MNPSSMANNMLKIITLILLAILLLAPISPAVAYIGPGAGISVLGSLLSILATIFVAIGAIIFWPLRKFMKRRKARRESLLNTETVSTKDDGSRNDS
jgi:membrane protein implicated in regulation of membrane protease activity